MNRTFGSAFVLLAVATPAVGSDVPAAASGWKRAKLPGGHGAIILNVPEDWRIQVIQPPNGIGIVQLGPRDVDPPPVSIDLLPDDPPDPETFRKQARSVRDMVSSHAAAADRGFPLIEFQGDEVLGNYFTYPVNTPKPGQKRFLTTGTMVVRDVRLPFQIRTDDRADPVIQAAVAILKDARKEASTREDRIANPSPYRARVSLRDRPWILLLDLPGFRPVLNEVRPEGTGAMLQAENADTHMTASAYIEDTRKMKSAAACKDALWTRSSTNSPPRSDVRESTRGGVIEVRYRMGETEPQSHVNAYRFFEGTCIEVQVTSTKPEPADDDRMRAILDSVRIEAKGFLDILSDMQKH